MESSVPAKRWWSKDTIAVVTGGNRGIGYELVKQLAEQGVTVVLTSRDAAKGQAAIDTLKAEGVLSVVSHPLDVTSKDSVQKLASFLKSRFGGIDILVNNAGIVETKFCYENAKASMDTNYYGVKNVTEGLLPLLRASPQGARIVMVTGISGVFERFLGESLKERFRDGKNLYTFEFPDSLVAEYLEDVKGGRKLTDEDWPWAPAHKAPMYGDSKIFLNTYILALEKSLSESQPDDHKIYVVGFCPGPTETDFLTQLLGDGYVPATNDHKIKSPAEGADNGVWLALQSKEELAGRVGKFFTNGEEFSFFWVNPPH